ncbi:hypothetical protein GDO78_022756 [Eleutherodactylus coqui]|uniref:CCHC-type domain-containing protein n=1 Tax=Eleutherodactylus coqui TaxID=57060 RepID=A0A8J6E4T6_ELECQ|nr:hypothetical protein GDO78_022756 [Eleutherodactylus coqui]
MAAQEQREVSLGPDVSTSPEPKCPFPEVFSGERNKFFVFQQACRLFFRMRPRSSGSEAQRVGLIMSLLRGSAQTWAFSIPEGSSCLQSVDLFFQELGGIFDEPDRAGLAVSRLLALHQGSLCVEDYCSNFRRYAGDTAWNDSALKDVFLQGLSDAVKDLLISHPVPGSLREAMELAVKADRRLRSRKQDRQARRVREVICPVPSSSVPVAVPEPMEVDPLDPKERRRIRLVHHPCFYCGKAGHRVITCPLRLQRSQSEPAEELRVLGDCREDRLGLQVLPKLLVPCQVRFRNFFRPGKAFIDSGAAANLISMSFVKPLMAEFVALETPIHFTNIDATPLSTGLVRWRTPGLQFMVGVLHSEELSFLVMEKMSVDVVLEISLVVSGPGTVKPTETLEKTCKVSGASLTDSTNMWGVHWVRQRDGKGLEWLGRMRFDTDIKYVLSLQGRITITRDTNKGEVYLKITEVKPEESGTYYCARDTV